jgi:hypothetical protein
LVQRHAPSRDDIRHQNQRGADSMRKAMRKAMRKGDPTRWGLHKKRQSQYQAPPDWKIGDRIVNASTLHRLSRMTSRSMHRRLNLKEHVLKIRGLAQSGRQKTRALANSHSRQLHWQVVSPNQRSNVAQWAHPEPLMGLFKHAQVRDPSMRHLAFVSLGVRKLCSANAWNPSPHLGDHHRLAAIQRSEGP